MTADQTNDPIENTVIEALRAQQRRYDVVIDNDLVLSVLPNGVKTWTWVYDDPADPHRKTLGIYPDMTLDDAKKSLASEKAAYRRVVDEASPDFVIRDGRIQPAKRPASQRPIVAGAIAAVVVGAILAWLFLGRDTKNTAADTAADDEILKPVAESVADIQLPSVTPTADAAPASNVAAGEPGQADLQRVAETTSLPRAEERLGTLTRTLEKPPAAAPATAPAQSASDPPAAAENPAVVSTPVLQTTPVLQNRPAAAPASAATLSDSGKADIRNADSSAEDGIALPSAGASVLILDSRVARGHLTTAVIQREPVDDLGAAIIGNGQDEQVYYFYTELRDLSGQRVRHRWVHNDSVVAEIPFNVGEAWRWRVYSSKTFIPSMAGAWRVQVLLEDDTVIYNLPFNFTP